MEKTLISKLIIGYFSVIFLIANPFGIWEALKFSFTILNYQDAFSRRFCGNGVPDWVPQPPEFNFPYPMEVEYEVDENGYPSR